MKSFSIYCVFFFKWSTFVTISFVKCSGEGKNPNNNPAAATTPVSSSSSSTEWINNVLKNSPSVSPSSIPLHNEAQEIRVASPRSSSNSFGWVDDEITQSSPAAQHSLHQNNLYQPSITTAVSSEVHQSDQNKRKNTLAALPSTQGIDLDHSTTLAPLRKYKYKEGTRKTKEANWRIHDHERWLRVTTKKAIKRRLERKGFKSGKESDTNRIRFNLKRLKENDPFRYTQELHDASIWRYNKNAPIHGKTLIKKFKHIQPEPTMKEMEEAHVKHRLHKCLARRERYNARRKQQCTSNNANG